MLSKPGSGDEQQEVISDTTLGLQATWNLEQILNSQKNLYRGREIA